LIVHR
ncbi:unnamed protein product, partial [Allacma fusca]